MNITSKRLVSLCLALMMLVGTVPVMAADNQSLADSVANEIVTLRKKDDLTKLFTLMDTIEDVDAFITAFDSAFNALAISESSSGLSVGELATLLYKTVGPANVNDDEAIVQILLNEASSGDLATVLGVNPEAESVGIDRLDDLFIIMGNSLIELQLGEDKKIFIASKDHQTLSIDSQRVTNLVAIANSLANLGISDTDALVGSLESMVTYFNGLTGDEKTALYEYLLGYGFVEGFIVRDIPSFEDLKDVLWAVDSINTMYRFRVINGKSERVFDPNGDITRAEFAALIVRLLDLKPTGASSFADVKDSDWYAEVVLICADNGFVNGVGDSKFAPLDTIPREQVLTVLGRILIDNGHLLVDGEIETILAKIPDSGDIDSWAREGVAVTDKYGIEISEESALDSNVLSVYPDRPATRAEVAEMLTRMTDYVDTVIVK